MNNNIFLKKMSTLY